MCQSMGLYCIQQENGQHRNSLGLAKKYLFIYAVTEMHTKILNFSANNRKKITEKVAEFQIWN